MYKTTFLTKKPVRNAFKGLLLGFLLATTLLYGTPVFAIDWIPTEGGIDSDEYITSITDEGTFYRFNYEAQTIPCVAYEPLAVQGYEFWDDELEEWDYLGGGSGGERCDGDYWHINANWTIPKSFLAETGYYRARFSVGINWRDDSNYLKLYYNGDNLFLIDDYEPETSVWGDDPASGTEITDLDTTITVGYEGLADYDSVYITFRHPPTGIFTGAKVYEIDDIGDSGDLEINLQDFDIEKNGNWYLHAVAVREGYQIEQGMFLSGYGWIWSEDLTAGDYYLDINIEGFEEIFAMSDFNSWYDENSKFDEPTAMFSAISGFFEPIFSTIGEFGSRIQDYFDTNTAYAKGEGIGRAIPFFAYYVEQVAVFMGGFPLMNWLLVIILFLVGIFIFRVILKFIPFFG